MQTAQEKNNMPHDTACSSDGTVTTSTAAALERARDAPAPVLQDIRHVADGVTVGEQVPATSAIAVIIEPGAKDEVCGGGEEDA